MPKKKTRPTGQHSLLDFIPDCIESLRQENEKEEAYSRSMLLENQTITNKENEHEYREQYVSGTNSNENNGQRNIQLVGGNGIAFNDNSIEDFGSLGIEQSREIKGTRETREWRGTIQQVRRSGGERNGSNRNGQILGLDRQWNEPLGSIENDGGTDRIIENYIITDSDNIGIGTPKQKYQDNINALKVLYNLKKNKSELATKEEQLFLSNMLVGADFLKPLMKTMNNGKMNIKNLKHY